jgi:hypothetical protein
MKPRTNGCRCIESETRALYSDHRNPKYPKGCLGIASSAGMQAQLHLAAAALSFPDIPHGEPHEPGAVAARTLPELSHETDATCDSSTLSSTKGGPWRSPQPSRPLWFTSSRTTAIPLRWNRSRARLVGVNTPRLWPPTSRRDHHGPRPSRSHLQDVRMDVPLRDRGRGSRAHRSADFVHPTLCSRPNT